MTPSDRICAHALELGFDLAGIAPATPVPTLPAYHTWLANGYHGRMGYMARPDRVVRRENPAAILPNARSIICVALNYDAGPPSAGAGQDPSRGVISRYARRADYHDVIEPRLVELAGYVGEELGGEVKSRSYVGTGPVLERAYAVQAGLGFIGKNTCLINAGLGSWLFLGEILVDRELAPTAKPAGGGCGACRRCLDACPTGALVAPYVLDARRCISYLTIELKGSIPPSLRPLMGNHIFGCDVCQDVCPWQKRPTPTTEPAPGAEQAELAPPLIELLGLDEHRFIERFARSPVSRAKRRGLLRNVAVAMGNWGDRRAEGALTRALRDPEPLVREHAAWALSRITETPQAQV